MFSLICERRCMSDWILKLLLMSWDVLQWTSAQIQGLTTDLLCIIWVAILVKIDFHIVSRWTVDWSSSSALLDYPHIIFIFRNEAQIWSSGSFEERLCPEALLSLFLSGGMIFPSLQNISHLLMNVYLFISHSTLYCVALYVWIFLSNYVNLIIFNHILLRHITGEWLLIFISFYASICFTDIKISPIYIAFRISSLLST